MAYLEELRNTAKAFGVDTGTEHMDAIQLYREIAKTLGIDLGTEHKGIVELLALINKALPDALGGGSGEGGSAPVSNEVWFKSFETSEDAAGILYFGPGRQSVVFADANDGNRERIADEGDLARGCMAFEVSWGSENYHQITVDGVNYETKTLWDNTWTKLEPKA